MIQWTNNCNMKCEPSSGTDCTSQPVQHVRHNVCVGTVGGCVGGPACVVCWWTWLTVSVAGSACTVWSECVCVCDYCTQWTVRHTNRLSFWMAAWALHWEIWYRESRIKKKKKRGATTLIQKVLWEQKNQCLFLLKSHNWKCVNLSPFLQMMAIKKKRKSEK